jgi:hypothetical protein
MPMRGCHAQHFFNEKTPRRHQPGGVPIAQD